MLYWGHSLHNYARHYATALATRQQDVSNTPYTQIRAIVRLITPGGSSADRFGSHGGTYGCNMVWWLKPRGVVLAVVARGHPTGW